MGNELEALVPYFIVSINGNRLAVEQEASVKKILVKDRIDAPSMCTITFSDTDRTWLDSSEFSEGQEVEVKLGYKDSCEPVFNGDITAVRANYNRNSDDVTTLICHNAIHRFATGEKIHHLRG
jgi:phage protein D